MIIKGKLNSIDLSKILKTFSENKETGSLVVINSENKIKKSFYFQEGSLCWVSSSQKISLDRIILGFKKISEEKIKKVIEIQDKTNKSLEEILMHQKIFSQSEFVEILKRQLLEEIYDVYTWEEGFYEFNREFLSDEFLKKIKKIQFFVDIDDLIRKGNLWNKKAKKWKSSIFTKKSLVFTVVARIKSQIGLFFDREKKIILLIDGNNKKDEIVEKSGLSEPEVSEILYALALRGIIFLKKDINDYIFFV